MKRDQDNSAFDLENDRKFNENLSSNIEKALEHTDAAVEKQEVGDNNTEDKKAYKSETTPLEDHTAEKTAETAAGKAAGKKSGDTKGKSKKDQTKKKKAEDKKAVDKKTEVKKIEDKKEDKKTENKKTDDKTAQDKKSVDKKVEDKKVVVKKTEGKKTEDRKTENKKTENKKTDVKKAEDKIAENIKAEDKKAEDKKAEDKKVGNSTEDNEVTSTESIEQEDKELFKGPTEFDDEITDINSSLAKQVSKAMDNQAVEVENLKKKRKLFKIQSGVLLTILCLIGFGFFFGFTKPGNSMLMSMGFNIGGRIWGSMTNKFNDSTKVVQDVDYLDEEDLQSTAPTVAPETIVWPKHPGEGKHEDGVYNILLLGEEAIGMGDGRGHTDVMVIATLNTKQKTVKLTSLMRDMLVQIPGYQDNKLNSAYAKGGLELLYKTIAENFDIRLDGCVKVNFNHFDKIVDDLGGLEITLKPNEADYLNTTNYISIKKYRNVKAGKQLLNGNQVLGYARVRKTSTITGQNNDYGRTDRHRIVLNAIYEKCKNKSKTELLSLMFKFLPMITTDINSDCFTEMLNAYFDQGMNTQKIQQLRLPADHTFEDNVRVRGMSVLIPDLEANRKVLSDFIFGEKSTGVPADGNQAKVTQAAGSIVSSTGAQNTGK